MPIQESTKPWKGEVAVASVETKEIRVTRSVLFALHLELRTSYQPTQFSGSPMEIISGLPSDIPSRVSE